MKRNLFIGMFVFVLMALTGMALFAQSSVDDQGRPNDPTINSHANACYVGGSMAGTCDTRSEWTCGWFVIRVEYGLMSTVPSICLPTVSQSTSTPWCSATPDCGTPPFSVQTQIAQPTEPYYVPTTVPVQPTFTQSGAQPTNTPHTMPCDLSCNSD